MRRTLVLSLGLGLVVAASGSAQDIAGRVFLPTPETISIHEFNGLPGADGDPIPNGTVVPDLSGNGLSATVEANIQTDLVANPGDPNFDVPAGANRECKRAGVATGPARVAVNNDGGAYEMEPEDDFSIELYVNRENVPGSANWGILAGTWHSRNLIEDTEDQNTQGAWYGYGLIRYEGSVGGTGGWGWVLSPVVDGVPRIGTGQAPEQFLQPWFEIPDGRHYVVLSVDRTQQAAVGYVDGVEVTRMSGLGADWAFTTPPGRDHARFLMFSGEDDVSRNSYRAAPAGVSLDAVRVQRKALTAQEVLEGWELISQGEPTPPPSETIQAVIVAGATDVLVDQCVLLDGSGSAPGAGRNIVKYEWRIGAGTFEEGGPTKEVSFASSDVPQVVVSLRVTNDAEQASSNDATIRISEQEVKARIAVKLGDADITSSEIVVPKWAVLTLDGTGSGSIVPAGAMLCPLDGDEPLAPTPIAAYEWDIDGDGTTDDTRASFDTQPLDTVGERTISLTARNQGGESDTLSVKVHVSDAEGNSNVFHGTDDTVFHLELNDLDPGPVADETPIEDLSGSGLALTIVDLVGGSIVAGDGAPHLEANVALTYAGGGSGPRGEVRDDGGLFEMDATQDFTFEIYVRPGEMDTPEWGDVAGTFKARTDGTEESPRYGWGIIKSDISDPELRTQNYRWFVCPGSEPGGSAEKAASFNLSKGLFSYVACVVNRTEQTSKVYVNGQFVSQFAPLDPAWSFGTPQGYPAAPFYLFTREQQTGEFSNCPPGVTVDALRLQLAALTPEQVQENWDDIVAGKGANAPTGPPEARFRRGDADAVDGQVNITDAIFVLNYLFQGGIEPPCLDAADSDNEFGINITDGIYILSYLFLGGPEPPAPGPFECGVDPPVDPPSEPEPPLDCKAYTPGC